jgi:O-antigen/teichoic acid export membrane protein
MSQPSAPRLPTWKKILGLLSDSAVYGASSALSQMIGLILLPLYSRYLDPEDYGIVAMLTVLTTLFVPVATLGMSNAIFRRFNVCKDEGERANVLTIGLVSIVIASITLSVCGMFFARSLSTILTGVPEYAALVRWSLLGAMSQSIGVVPQVVLRADRRVKTMAAFNTFKVLATVTVTVFLLLIVGMRAEGMVIGQAAGSVLGDVAMFATTFRRFQFFVHDASVIRAMLAYGLPFVPHNLQAAGLVMLGQYIVRTHLGLDDAGLYNVAAKLTAPFGFAVTAIQLAWVPYKFQIHAYDEDPKEFFRTVFTYYCAGMSYLWLGVSVWGPEMLRLLADPKFHSAAPLVPFIATIALAHGLRFMLSTGMELGDDTRMMPLASFCGLVTALVGCIVLIRVLGVPGAALGTAAAWLVMGSMLYFVAQRRFRIDYDWPVVGALLGISCALIAVDYVGQFWLNVWGRVVLAAVFSLAYPGVVFLVLSRSTTERARMKSLVKRLRRFRASRKSGDAVARQPARQLSPPPIADDAVEGDPTSVNA